MSDCSVHRISSTHLTADRNSVVLFGTYYRSSDRALVQRLRCKSCGRTFSTASMSPCFNQKKRQVNIPVLKELCSGVSQRRIAYLKNLNRKTVARKLKFLGIAAKEALQLTLLNYPKTKQMTFDDLETIEHTKLKPLSVTLAVDDHSRRILGIEVSTMGAKGLLVAKSLKKYGKLKDERRVKREQLFTRIKPFIENGALIKSDENPYYLEDVKRHFPNSIHETWKGQRGSLGGQGELKKIRFDPLFTLNHTCAMLRANINRLYRKTWCTTKKKEMLEYHLNLYALFHNECAIYQNQKVK